MYIYFFLLRHFILPSHPPSIRYYKYFLDLFFFTVSRSMRKTSGFLIKYLKKDREINVGDDSSSSLSPSSLSVCNLYHDTPPILSVCRLHHLHDCHLHRALIIVVLQWSSSSSSSSSLSFFFLTCWEWLFGRHPILLMGLDTHNQINMLLHCSVHRHPLLWLLLPPPSPSPTSYHRWTFKFVCNLWLGYILTTPLTWWWRPPEFKPFVDPTTCLVHVMTLRNEKSRYH